MTGKKVIEQEARQKRLPSAVDRLQIGKDGGVLERVVTRFFPTLTNVFILYWIPEQGEDIYWLLVSKKDIAKIEIPRRCESAASMELTDVEAFWRKPPSIGARRKLEIALGLL